VGKVSRRDEEEARRGKEVGRTAVEEEARRP